MIRRVEVENWRSHADSKVDFPPGISLVLGPNGAGKTSLLQAMAFGLYGVATEQLASCLRAGSDSGRVSVEFSPPWAEDGEVYRVEREVSRTDKGAGSKAKLLKLEGPRAKVLCTGSKKVRGEVEELLGIPADVFQNSVHIQQGEIHALLSEAPGKRKELMDRLLGFDKYERAWKGIRELVKHYDQTVTATSAAVKELEADVDSLGGEREKLRELRDERDKLARKRAELEEETENSKEEADRLGEVVGRAQDFLEKKSALVAAVKSLERERENLAGVVGEVLVGAGAGAGVDADANALDVESLASARALMESEATRLDEELGDLAAKREELAGKLGAAAELEKRRDSAEARVAELKEELAETVDQLKRLVQFDDAFELAGVVASVRRREEELERELEELEALAARASDAREDELLVQFKVDDLQVAIKHVGEERACPTCSTELDDAGVERVVADLEGRLKRLEISLAKKAAKSQRAGEERAEREARVAALREEVENARKAEILLQTLEKGRKALRRAERELERISSGEVDPEGLREELGQLERRAADLERERREIEGNLAKLASWEPNWTRVNQELATAREELDHFLAQGDGEDGLEEVERAKIELEGIRLRVEQLTTELARLAERLDLLDGRLIPEVEGRVARLEEKQGKLAELKRNFLAAYKKKQLVEFLRIVIRQVEPVVRASVLRELNALASRFFFEIFGPSGFDKLEFDPENYGLVVYRGGVAETGTRLSGGELVACSLSTRLAISQVLAGDRVKALPLLILDEPTVFLDQNRKAHLVRSIRRLESVPQLVVVTHDQQFEDVADHMVLVEKAADGTSLVRAETPDELEPGPEVDSA
ncbi:MAG: DNA double-strand break repair ATPase Rad50 [Promethearchaeota archaeon]